ncbi:MAG: hypothetical protein QM811_18760 [Pirellulales bacterium]
MTLKPRKSLPTPTSLAADAPAPLRLFEQPERRAERRPDRPRKTLRPLGIFRADDDADDDAAPCANVPRGRPASTRKRKRTLTRRMKWELEQHARARTPFKVYPASPDAASAEHAAPPNERAVPFGAETTLEPDRPSYDELDRWDAEWRAEWDDDAMDDAEAYAPRGGAIAHESTVLDFRWEDCDDAPAADAIPDEDDFWMPGEE